MFSIRLMFSDILLKYCWEGLNEIIGVTFLAQLTLKKGTSIHKIHFLCSGREILHTLPSNKHGKIQLSFQIPSSVLRIFCSYGKETLKNVYQAKTLWRENRNQSITLCPKYRRAAESDCPALSVQRNSGNWDHPSLQTCHILLK